MFNSLHAWYCLWRHKPSVEARAIISLLEDASQWRLHKGRVSKISHVTRSIVITPQNGWFGWSYVNIDINGMSAGPAFSKVDLLRFYNHAEPIRERLQWRKEYEERERRKESARAAVSTMFGEVNK